MRMASGPLAVVVAVVALAWASGPCLAGDPAGNSDWPQYCGPTRNNAVANSPKLLDTWPTNGPTLLWKSEAIPSYYLGSCASPVVADGKVFLYVDWRQPKDGGQKYKIITTELLADAGWLPDLPDELARKIEDVRVATNRPVATGYPDWTTDTPPTDAALDTFLSKNAALDKYIKDFTATLDPKDAQKYGAYIKRRFCMEKRSHTWDGLVALSKLRDGAYETEFEWGWRIAAIQGLAGWMGKPVDYFKAWRMATTRRDMAICLDAATGKTLWKKDFPQEPETLKADFAGHPMKGFTTIGVCATPAVSNGKCYAAGVSGLYCLSATDGALLWQAKTPLVHSSPLVVDGVVFQGDSAFHAGSGKLLWRIANWGGGPWSPTRNCSPASWTCGGTNYVIHAAADNRLCCMELQTGSVLWTMETGAWFFGFPVINGDIMMVIDGSKKPRALRAFKLSPAGATLLWSGRSMSDGEGSYTVWKDHVYFLCGVGLNAPTRAECLDLKTGESKWISESYFVPGGSETPVGQPIAADGKILRCDGNFHGSSFNNCTPRRDSCHTMGFEMFSANPDGRYVRLGRFEPGAAMMASPALADGKLYLRLENGIACFDLRAK